jgi:hypothetical protein
MKKKPSLILGALTVVGATAGRALHAYPVQVSLFAASTRNYILGKWDVHA